MSTTTFATLKADVAAIVGSEADPLGVRADRSIARAIKWLKRINWFYLGMTVDIPLVDSTGLTSGQEGFEGTYTLPSTFKEVYSLLTGFNLGAGERPKTWNDYVDSGLLDRLTSDEGQFQARFRSRHLYTLWNSKASGRIKIIDAPTQTGLAELKYFRHMNFPVEDTDIIDVLDGPMENALTARAQYYTLMLANPRERGLRRDLFAESELDRRKARGQDRSNFGAQFELLPPDVHVARGNRLSINNTALDDYGYGGY
jgi:hypothetical protein